MTRVTFRVFEGGEIIALFPDFEWANDGSITCYVHVGQHGGASPDLLHLYPKATPEQYTPLLHELQNIGYDDLEVV